MARTSAFVSCSRRARASSRVLRVTSGLPAICLPSRQRHSAAARQRGSATAPQRGSATARQRHSAAFSNGSPGPWATLRTQEARLSRPDPMSGCGAPPPPLARLPTCTRSPCRLTSRTATAPRRCGWRVRAATRAARRCSSPRARASTRRCAMAARRCSWPSSPTSRPACGNCSRRCARRCASCPCLVPRPAPRSSTPQK